MKLSKITVIILFMITIVSCSKNDNEAQRNEILELKDEFDQLRRNEELVRNFYQEFFGDLKIEAAANKYLGDVYIQHNPNLGDGREELIEKAKIWFKGKEPFTVDVRRVFASGDYVFIHTKGKGGKHDKGVSVMDVFMVKNNKLIEHWDTMQDIPEKAANNHPFFREL